MVRVPREREGTRGPWVLFPEALAGSPRGMSQQSPFLYSNWDPSSFLSSLGAWNVRWITVRLLGMIGVPVDSRATLGALRAALGHPVSGLETCKMR